MIDQKAFFEIVMVRFSDFYEKWFNAEIKEVEDYTPCRCLMFFVDYIIDSIEKNDQIDLGNVFYTIEEFLVNGDQDVKDAAATCFLESLVNMSSWGRISPNTFVPLLGPESRACCRGWDEFTGVKTEGLW